MSSQKPVLEETSSSKLDKRESLILAAMKVMREKGLAQCTARAIADASPLSKSEGKELAKLREEADQAAVDAMRGSADPLGADPAVVIGDTGSAGWAGFLAAVGDGEIRAALGLDGDSRVAVVVTEGATDPAVYREIVGRSPEEVAGA